jgi:addiction module HigA family antidote
MAISNTAKREIPPTHPGEMLREDFMPDYRLTASSLAAALGVSRQTVNELLRERRAITPTMALRLSRLFGNSPEFWLNAQQARDIWQSEKRYHKELSQIQPIQPIQPIQANQENSGEFGDDPLIPNSENR